MALIQALTLDPLRLLPPPLLLLLDRMAERERQGWRLRVELCERGGVSC